MTERTDLEKEISLRLWVLARAGAFGLGMEAAGLYGKNNFDIALSLQTELTWLIEHLPEATAAQVLEAFTKGFEEGVKKYDWTQK